MRVVLLLCLMSSAALAAPITPSSPPPGWAGTQADWKEVWDRADHYAKKAAKLVKGADVGCIHGVLLRILGDHEAAVSNDAFKGEPDVKMTVHPKNAAKFKASLKENRDERCGPPGSGGVVDSAEAIARMAANESEWVAANYTLRRGDLAEAVTYLSARSRPALTPSTPWVVEMLKLGIFVPAAGAAGAVDVVVGAATGTIILNPRLFMRREVDPNETL